MKKKTTSNSVTTATIEEQTAAFLRAGGTIQYVEKGTSGNIQSSGSKQLTPKNDR